MKYIRLVFILLTVIIVCLITSSVVFSATKETSIVTPQATNEPFDHSNCQYPLRWSNPPDGCDNSDPAVPECIGKFSTQEEESKCIADYIKAHTETKETTQTPIPPTNQQPSNQCK